MRIISLNINNKTSTPFGSPLIGRTYQAETLVKYRYSFNGKEKDNETYGDGNELDFGARVYDGRLGRWLSVDPSIQTQADQSSYKAMYNNPIIFIDPDGKDEFLILKVINKATGKTEIKIIKLSVKYYEKKVWESNDFSSDEHYYYDYYNTFTFATLIIEKDGTISGNNNGTFLAKSPTYTRHPLFRLVGKLPNPGSAEGKGCDVPGGIRLTADEGGEMQTKMRTLNKDTKSYNITTLLIILGLKSPENLSKVLDLANKLKSIIEKAKEAKENYEKMKNTDITQKSKDEDIDTVIRVKGRTKGLNGWGAKDSSVKVKNINKVKNKVDK